MPNDMLSKDISIIKQDISLIKEQIQNIDSKIDLVLEILNSFTLMVLDDDEDDEESYETDNTWLPEESFYNEDDEWNSHEDES